MTESVDAREDGEGCLARRTHARTRRRRHRRRDARFCVCHKKLGRVDVAGETTRLKPFEGQTLARRSLLNIAAKKRAACLPSVSQYAKRRRQQKSARHSNGCSVYTASPKRSRGRTDTFHEEGYSASQPGTCNSPLRFLPPWVFCTVAGPMLAKPYLRRNEGSGMTSALREHCIAVCDEA